eukprot:TRINITY_DN3809_c0_g1_i1.p1 TRINITY_DN3809_c0_g1~~TRINITY_DN3809_c0_g1_i1.p1  ORF type:complete len:345 (-),score=64.48 TRINITY_DN3809_c0_g1_i1:489-1523(-)
MALWEEHEVELVSSSEESDTSDLAGSSSDGEPWHHISRAKRVLIFGGTMAFVAVFVVLVASAAMTPAIPPPPVPVAETPQVTSTAHPQLRGALDAEGAATFSKASSTAPPTATTRPAAQPSTAAPTEPMPAFPELPPGLAPEAPAAATIAEGSAQSGQPWVTVMEGANKRRRPSQPALKPNEQLHDGNVCDDTEELYAGLCYRKCSMLTGIPTATRFTAFSCCPTGDCPGNVLKLKTASMLPCRGYDVSSQDGGKACPHVRGECLVDEEQFGGECFEKCSILTNGKFPKRIGAASCCNPDGPGGCLNFGNDETKGSLNVGGGAGDSDSSTPRRSHYPLKYLTEK